MDRADNKPRAGGAEERHQSKTGNNPNGHVLRAARERVRVARVPLAVGSSAFTTGRNGRREDVLLRYKDALRETEAVTKLQRRTFLGMKTRLHTSCRWRGGGRHVSYVVLQRVQA